MPIAALALWRHHFVVLGVLAACLFILLGLGIAIPQLRLFGPYICRGSDAVKRVALTFDDGPDPASTNPLLDLLREARVPAAFFCIGKRVAAHPEVAARIVCEGHLLENHSYDHSNFTNFYSTKRLREELARAQTVIAQNTKVVPRMFRPPMGLSNPRVFRAAEALGLKVIGWTTRGLDTQKPAIERVVARIERGLKPGAIILLHDGGIPPERLVATVKVLLERLTALGYGVVRLDELLRERA